MSRRQCFFWAAFEVLLFVAVIYLSANGHPHLLVAWAAGKVVAGIGSIVMLWPR